MNDRQMRQPRTPPRPDRDALQLDPRRRMTILRPFRNGLAAAMLRHAELSGHHGFGTRPAESNPVMMR